MVWQFVGALAAFDRLAQRITLVQNVFVGDDPEGQYLKAVSDPAAAAQRLGQPAGYTPRTAEPAPTPPAPSRMPWAGPRTTSAQEKPSRSE